MTREKWVKVANEKKTLAETADKHKCYHQSVQAPKNEITTLLGFYRVINASKGPKEPEIFREDFCGTAILCKEWVGRSPTKEAYGVDIDPQVIKYSQLNVLPTTSAAERIRLYVADVLKVNRVKLGIPPADIITSLNYGIFYFKQRALLVDYLRKCYEALADGGILACDMFGGAQCYEANKSTEREYGEFKYFFEQRSFDTMTNTAKCALHFLFKDGSWLKNAYTYDFRVYTIPEVKEALLEAGFKSIHVWWADTKADKPGRGSLDEGEDFSDNDGVYEYEKMDLNAFLEGTYAWNAYIVARK